MNKITVEFEPFHLPNFLRIEAFGTNAQFPVADLTDEQASAYWDWMRDKWLAHVKERRDAKEPR